MAIPSSVAEFLAGKRFAVAGVSRDSRQPANAIYRKLRAAGYEVVPLNPRAAEVGRALYPDLGRCLGPHGLVVASPGQPSSWSASPRTVAFRIWFHRSLGRGRGVDAVRECEVRRLSCCRWVPADVLRASGPVPPLPPVGAAVGQARPG
jgi:hypothetical protein